MVRGLCSPAKRELPVPPTGEQLTPESASRPSSARLRRVCASGGAAAKGSGARSSGPQRHDGRRADHRARYKQDESDSDAGSPWEDSLSSSCRGSEAGDFPAGRSKFQQRSHSAVPLPVPGKVAPPRTRRNTSDHSAKMRDSLSDFDSGSSISSYSSIRSSRSGQQRRQSLHAIGATTAALEVHVTKLRQEVSSSTVAQNAALAACQSSNPARNSGSILSQAP